MGKTKQKQRKKAKIKMISVNDAFSQENAQIRQLVDYYTDRLFAKYSEEPKPEHKPTVANVITQLRRNHKKLFEAHGNGTLHKLISFMVLRGGLSNKVYDQRGIVPAELADSFPCASPDLTSERQRLAGQVATLEKATEWARKLMGRAPQTRKRQTARKPPKPAQPVFTQVVTPPVQAANTAQRKPRRTNQPAQVAPRFLNRQAKKAA